MERRLHAPDHRQPGSCVNPARGGQDADQHPTGTGTGSSVATGEATRLIASDKVEGTAVYNRQGERLGSVYNFMVDKRSGQVAYAVLSFGSFLGIGDSYYPLPWKSLKYDTGQGRASARDQPGQCAGCRERRKGEETGQTHEFRVWQSRIAIYQIDKCLSLA